MTSPNQCPHDDWVSSVDGSNPGFILTGCYDGLGRIWKGPQVCTHILEGHTKAITSVRLVNPRGLETTHNLCVATASEDHTLRLWKLDANEPLDHPVSVTSFQILHGHMRAVDCVYAPPRGDMVCSGSQDYSIKIWNINEPEEDAPSLKKRRKDKAGDEYLTKGDEAVSTLSAHSEGVSSVVWPEDEVIYSASWDFSIRTWDAETGIPLWKADCGTAISCLDVGGLECGSLIAAGASDVNLRVYDAREPGTSGPAFKLSSHTKWIDSCKWHRKSRFHLISGSGDGKVKLWDLRTQLPLADIQSQEDAVMCVDWWGDDCVVNGGEDNKLQILSGISAHQEEPAF